jgi:hypothetical protein
VESQLNVLTRSEAEVGLGGRELECVGAGVFGEGCAGDELDGDPAVLLEDGAAGVVGRGGEFFCGGFGVLFYEGGGFGGYGAEDAFWKLSGSESVRYG